MLSFCAKRNLTFLEKKYVGNVVPKLKSSFGISNPHMIPVIEKVVVSMRFGRDAGDKKAIESAIEELSLITGKKPAVSFAKKSIATFKLRKGEIAGAYCTLRGVPCYQFLERLIYIAFPRIRDFKGFTSSSFDSDMNFNFGISDHLIFQELTYDKIHKTRGLDVSIRIRNAKTKDHALTLLQLIDFPIK